MNHKHDTKWMKADTQDYILYDSTYIDVYDILEKARYQWQETGQGLSAAGGWGRRSSTTGGAGKYLRGQKCFASFKNFIIIVIYLAALGS